MSRVTTDSLRVLTEALEELEADGIITLHNGVEVVANRLASQARAALVSRSPEPPAAGGLDDKAGQEICRSCGAILADHIGNTGVVYPCWEPSGQFRSPEPRPEPPLPELLDVLAAHRRYHGKVGCPGGDDCYVCQAEDALNRVARTGTEGTDNG